MNDGGTGRFRRAATLESAGPRRSLDRRSVASLSLDLRMPSILNRVSSPDDRFLLEAVDALSSSLDYSATIANVARAPLPRLADLCIVDLPEESGSDLSYA